MPAEADKPWLSRRGRRIDFARRDAFNRQLGQLGEQFAVEIEKHRLRSAERDDLAAKVEWVAQTCGDGVGFDVLSFDARDDSEQFIEVKTTGLGKHFPFYVTANEVRCSEDRPGPVPALSRVRLRPGRQDLRRQPGPCRGSVGWSRSCIGYRSEVT